MIGVPVNPIRAAFGSAASKLACNVGHARGEEGATAAACDLEGGSRCGLPNIVDDQQNTPIAQQRPHLVHDIFQRALFAAIASA